MKMETKHSEIYVTHKSSSKREVIVKKVYLRKREKYQVNNLTLHIKPEKEWALSIPLLMSMSEAFSVPFLSLTKLLHKSSWVVKNGP